MTAKEVVLTVKAQETSGGHNHVPGRPDGSLNPSGGNSPLSFSFIAAESAGDHVITAKCADGQCGAATGNVWVGIKDLVSLNQAIGAVLYNLVGKTDTHPKNHYLTWNQLGSTVWLGALYRQTFPGDPVLHYNDASLERGGLFDLRNNWSHLPVGHETHRRGDIIDVAANPAINPGIAIPERNFKAFERLACRTGGVARIHSRGTDNQHYHVEFKGCTERTVNPASVSVTPPSSP